MSLQRSHRDAGRQDAATSAALFATIADRYDLITVVAVVRPGSALEAAAGRSGAPAPGARALDLATGTGDIAFALAARGARVVGLDVTPRMIELARAKAPARLAGRVHSSSATCSRCRFPTGRSTS